MATTSSNARALARPARRGALLLATVLTVSACAGFYEGESWEAEERADSRQAEPQWRSQALPEQPAPDLGGLKDALDLMPSPAGLREGLERRRNAEPTKEKAGIRQMKLIQLSYVDADTALYMLQALGVSVGLAPATTATTPIPKQPAFNSNSLPQVFKIPDPTDTEYAQIGPDDAVAKFGAGTGAKEVAALAKAGKLSKHAAGAPMTQLMVIYERPEQFSKVRRLLDDYVDRPARQVLIEGMVLEINERGLQKLGVEWDLKSDQVMRWAGGALVPAVGDGGNTLELAETAIRDLGNDEGFDWFVTLNALVREGNVEILSRPSVLTLNNRQTTIRVGEDIPVAKSNLVATAGATSFEFNYLSTGIQLNVKPRINEEGDEVTMLIDTVVSSADSSEPLQIKSGDNVLAEAPRIDTRRVRTYARIPNNTPLIIGGLISRNDTSNADKVPFLGDLPLVGAAFRGTKTENRRREVIIVLTPYVLPENRERLRPVDADRFDSFDNELFRDSYRLRREDVFDLSFLYEDPTLQEFRDLALEAVAQDHTLAEQRPYRDFVGETPPGQDVLATRMLFGLVERLDDREEFVKDGLLNNRIILVDRKSVKANGYAVRYLEGSAGSTGSPSMAQQFGRGTTMRSFFQHHREKQALRITFLENTLGSGRAPPVPPSVAIEPCPDDQTYRDLLWKWNQPTGRKGWRARTILLRKKKDLDRLRHALALKRLIALNGGPDEVLRNPLSAGSMLLIPDIRPKQAHVMDAEVATYFFREVHYYSAAIGEIDSSTRALRRALVKLLK